MMKGEHLKTVLLILLVVSSFLLTLANWNHQPQFEMVGNGDDLVDAQIETGHRLTKSEVLQPMHIIYHDQEFEKPIGVSNKGTELEVYRGILEYSLYDFAIFNLDDEWWDQIDTRVEVIFATELPSETIHDLFSVDQQTSIPRGVYNRIDIIFNDESYDILFRNNQDDRVIAASLQNHTRNVERLKNFFLREDFITYEVFQSSRETDIFLPNQIDSNVLLFSYGDISVDPFRNFLFPSPSVVRSARSLDGDTVFIDGTRELILKSNQISFTNQTNEQKVSDDDIPPYQLLDQVQNFINAHNGFTFEPPFNYFLSELKQTPRTNEVEFTLSYQGMPIFSHADISRISIAWHNQEVYTYQHPLIRLVEQRGIGRESANLVDAETVIRILNGEFASDNSTYTEYYHGSAIYDVAIGYRVRGQVGGQGQVYELIPTWYVKGINGWQPLIIPADATGGDHNAVGTN